MLQKECKASKTEGQRNVDMFLFCEEDVRRGQEEAD